MHILFQSFQKPKTRCVGLNISLIQIYRVEGKAHSPFQK